MEKTHAHAPEVEAELELGPTQFRMGNAIVDINDDNEIRAILGPQILRQIRLYSAIKIRNALVNSIVEMRLLTLKLGFMLERAKKMEASGIGIQTLQDVQTQMMIVSSLGKLSITYQQPAPELVLPTDSPVEPVDEL